MTRQSASRAVLSFTAALFFAGIAVAAATPIVPIA